MMGEGIGCTHARAHSKHTRVGTSIQQHEHAFVALSHAHAPMRTLPCARTRGQIHTHKHTVLEARSKASQQEHKSRLCQSGTHLNYLSPTLGTHRPGSAQRGRAPPAQPLAPAQVQHQVAANRGCCHRPFSDTISIYTQTCQKNANTPAPTHMHARTHAHIHALNRPGSAQRGRASPTHPSSTSARSTPSRGPSWMSSSTLLRPHQHTPHTDKHANITQTHPHPPTCTHTHTHTHARAHYTDPEVPNAVVLPRPTLEHQRKFNTKSRPIVDVVIDPYLAVHLRPHQVRCTPSTKGSNRIQPP